MQKSLVKDLFNKLSEEEIIESAIRAAEDLHHALVLIYGDANIEAALAFTATRLKKSGFVWREFEEEKANNSGEDERQRKFILHHDMGHKWSIFAREYIARLVDTVGYKVVSKSEDGTVIFLITTPH